MFARLIGMIIVGCVFVGTAEAQEPVKKCGAVAYVASGAFGAAYGLDDCTEAEKQAIAACRQNAPTKEMNDCSVGTIVKINEWFAVRFCKEGNSWNTGVETHESLSGLGERASLQPVNKTTKKQYHPSSCRVLPGSTFHAVDGLRR